MIRLSLPADKRASGPLWRNVTFLLMWSSVAASGFGDRVINLAALTLMGSTGDDIQGTSVNAGLMFFFFLPYLLLGLPGGWLADKLPRKWIMLACDESRALVLLAAFLLVPAAGTAAEISEDHFWRIYATIFAVGICAAIFNPARNATIPQIVPSKHLQAANALIIGIAVIANLIGLGLGKFIFDPDEAASVRSGLLIGCLFFAISGTFFAFLKIRPRIGHATSSRRIKCRSTSALRYVLSHRSILALVILNMVVWGSALVVYNAAMGLCKQQYGFVDPKIRFDKYTTMALAIGLGMLSGAIWVAWMNTRRESGWLAMVALLFAAFCTSGLAFSANYTVGLAMAFGVGFFGNTTIVCITTLLQSITPNFIRGRVMGLNLLANTTTNVTVNFIIWRMNNADTLIITTLKVMSVLLGVIAAWGLWQQCTRGPLSTRLENVVLRCFRAYLLIWHRLRWFGRHHIPRSGAVIMASNHPTAIDPMIIQCSCRHLIRWVMLKSFRFPILEPLWRRIEPICLEGTSADLNHMRQVVAILNEGQVVGLFPEGGLQRENRELKPFQRGLGMIARRSRAKIVPIWIAGPPLTRHMIWHFLKPSRTTIIFGPPFKADSDMTNEQIVELLRNRLLELRKAVPG